MSHKLTRRGARNVTATLDRLASLLQENPDVLGVDSRIAKDFAYRCDILSDTIEARAASNYPREAGELPDALKEHQFKKDDDKKEDEEESKKAADEEGMSLPNDGWDEDQIADKVPGPLEGDSDESEYMSEYTEVEHHELGERQEGGQLENGVKAAKNLYGFDLFAADA